MAKYIYQHRRASKDVLSNKETLIPQEGELIVEFDHEKNLHRLKIGDGSHKYSELSYLMAGDEILTQALPDVMQITLDVDEWEIDEDYAGEDSLCTCYRQEITVERATTKSRLDLQPDVDMLAEFQKLGIVLVTKNINGQIFVYSIGNMPTKTYTMQATLIVTDILDPQDKVLGIPIGASVSLDETNARVSALEEKLSDILYEPIAITSFVLNSSARVKEIGEKVTEVTLSWVLNRDPVSLTLDDEAIDVTLRSLPIDGLEITYDNNDKTWTLEATGEKDDDIATQTTPRIKFYNGVYYGSIDADAAIDNDTILSLGKNIRGNRAGSFKTTQPSQRGIFVCPTTYGTPQFKIGETPLPYTWEKVNTEPFMLVNVHEYVAPSGYDIWRSYQNIEAQGTNITVV